MKIEVIMKYHRPDTSVEFYRPELSFMAYRQSKYVETDKIIVDEKSISEDGLIRTYRMIFLHRDCFLEYHHDPLVKDHYRKRNEYNQLNGIEKELNRAPYNEI